MNRYAVSDPSAVTSPRSTSGGLSLSAENRETTITPYKGGTRITSDDGWMPDFTARYAWKGTWGHVAVAGLLRELVLETTGTGAIDDSTWTGALSLSGKFNFGKDDVRWMGMYGNLGRYVGLNFANDAVLDGSGNLDKDELRMLLAAVGVKPSDSMVRV